MNYSTYFILLILLLSCGERAKNNVQITLSRSFSFSSDYKGGAVLVAERIDKTQKIVTAINEDSIKLNLTNGLWDFAIIAWEGETGEILNADGVTVEAQEFFGIFSGDHKCGSTRKNIGKDNAQFNIFISKDNCINPTSFDGKRFANQAGTKDMQFKKLEFWSCTDPLNLDIENFGCDDQGFGRSFKIKIPAVNDSVSTNFSAKSLVSKCISYKPNGNYMSDSYQSVYNSQLRFPVATDFDGIIPFAIESYPDFECQDNLNKKVISNIKNFEKDQSLRASFQSLSDLVGVFFQHKINMTEVDFTRTPLADDLTTTPVLFNWGRCLNFEVQNTSDDPVLDSYARINFSSLHKAIYYSGANCRAENLSLSHEDFILKLSNKDGKASFSVIVFDDGAISSESGISSFDISLRNYPSSFSLTSTQVNLITPLFRNNLWLNSANEDWLNKMIFFKNNDKLVEILVSNSFSLGSSLSFSYRIFNGSSWSSSSSETLTLGECTSLIAGQPDYDFCYRSYASSFFLYPQAINNRFEVLYDEFINSSIQPVIPNVGSLILRN